MTLSLTWRGVDAGCANYILNGQSILAGTPVRVSLEQHGPVVGPRPEFLEVSLQLESPLKRVFRTSRVRLDRLVLYPRQRPDTHEIASTEPFLVKPPAETKGSSRIVCTVRGAGDPTAWIDSVASDRGFQVSTQDPRHYSAKSSVAIEALEGTIELGGRGGSSSELTRYIVTAVDPRLHVSIALPGADHDLRSYAENYVSDIAELLGQRPKGASNEFFSVWSAYLGNDVAQDIQVEVAPSDFILDEGEVQIVTAIVSARRASRRPALVAVEVADSSTGLSSVSDMIRINRSETGGPRRSRRQGQVAPTIASREMGA